ncbi:MAG: TonB-dependent receptor [Tannerella sp.]|jgi:TonB-linked SusC/RagA family outer membrane protein|nr:TonB-dependent receptor [Tannerella sp.]
MKLKQFFCFLLISIFCGIFELQAKPEKVLPEAGVTQQKVRVKGKVIDEGGEAIAGATVQIEGTTTGVITDPDGMFEMEVPAQCRLTASFLGMVTKTVAYNGEKEITITLESNAKMLEEVEVVAFSKQKKESVVASISTVKPSELRVPSSNLTTAFAGRVAGLISYQLSGEPGADNASFFIRGITTFGADAKKDPLILIDGMELGTEDLARLNTDDIQSFSVMKDASATALYGARGANGVIMVTTKEGREGKVAVSARIENSFSSPTQMVEVADPITFMRMHNEAVKTRDPLGLALYSEEKIIMTERGMYPDMYPATDWYGMMFDPSISNQRANVSLSGGGAIARYYVAANITKDNGNIKVDKRNNFNSNINLLKYNVRMNVNINLTKTTELISRANITFDNYTGPYDSGADMYRKVMQTNPVLFKPYYEPDEEYAYAKHILFGNYGNAGYLNPYAQSLRGYKDYNRSQVLSQFELKQNLNMITEGLTARATVNLERKSEVTVARGYAPFFYNISSFNPLTEEYRLMLLNPGGGTEYIDYGIYDPVVNSSFYLEAAAEWNRQFDKHSLGALLVYTMRDEKVGFAQSLQLSLPNRNIGLAGRLAYNFDTRYFLEFDFGYNGSERFAKKNRWGFFPAVAAGWMLSNEGFFEPLKDVFTTFKLKGTYGLVGSDAIGSNDDRFYYLSQVNMAASRAVNWGEFMSYNPLGISVSRYPNEEIGWETSYKTNLGLEFETKGGLSGNFEVYRERRENILINRIIPSTMGIIPAVKANMGVGQGQGIDLELNYEKNVNKDLWFIGRGTFTLTKSKVLEWEEPDYTNTPWLSRVGKPVNQAWGLIAERLFIDDMEVFNSPTQFGVYEAGDIKYRDVNGDGRISDLDRVPIGYPTEPEINYGFGLSAGYKDFDFSFFFTGQARKSFWPYLTGNGNITPFMDGSYVGTGNDGWVGQNAILQVIADSYWSETNRDPYAFWPRLANYWIDNNIQGSTWFMQDASFLRLKTVEIGYTVPENILKKTLLNNFRVYVSGTNLYCWSGFKLWDPEMGGEGLGYPLQRVINVGITVGI